MDRPGASKRNDPILRQASYRSARRCLRDSPQPHDDTARSACIGGTYAYAWLLTASNTQGRSGLIRRDVLGKCCPCRGRNRDSDPCGLQHAPISPRTLGLVSGLFRKLLILQGRKWWLLRLDSNQQPSGFETGCSSDVQRQSRENYCVLGVSRVHVWRKVGGRAKIVQNPDSG